MNCEYGNSTHHGKVTGKIWKKGQNGGSKCLFYLFCHPSFLCHASPTSFLSPVFFVFRRGAKNPYLYMTLLIFIFLYILKIKALYIYILKIKAKFTCEAKRQKRQKTKKTLLRTHLLSKFRTTLKVRAAYF